MPLLPFVTLLLRRRWVIVLGTVVLMIATGVHTKFFATPVFTASVKFLPSKGNDMSARMSSIVGPGMRLNEPDDTASSDYYTALLRSSLFLDRMISKPFATQKFGMPKPLIDYLEVVAENDIQRRQKAIARLNAAVAITASRPTAGRLSLSFLTLTVSTPEPQLSADLANAFLDEVLLYNQTTRNAKATQNRVFIEKQLKDNQELLDRAESDLASFSARNRRLATPDLEARKERLTRAVKVQEEVFVTLKKQLELARIQEQENQASIEIIEKAIPPLARSAPSTRSNVALAGFLGLFFFSGLVILMDMVKKLDPEDEATREFLSALEEVKGDFVKIGKSF